MKVKMLILSLVIILNWKMKPALYRSRTRKIWVNLFKVMSKGFYRYLKGSLDDIDTLFIYEQAKFTYGTRLLHYLTKVPF